MKMPERPNNTRWTSWRAYADKLEALLKEQAAPPQGGELTREEIQNWILDAENYNHCIRIEGDASRDKFQKLCTMALRSLEGK